MDKFSLYLQSDFDRYLVLLNGAVALVVVNDDRTITFTSEYHYVVVARDVLVSCQRNMDGAKFTVNGTRYTVALYSSACGALDSIIGQLYDYD